MARPGRGRNPETKPNFINDLKTHKPYKTSIGFNQKLLVNNPKPKKGTPTEGTGRVYLDLNSQTPTP